MSCELCSYFSRSAVSIKKVQLADVELDLEVFDDSIVLMVVLQQTNLSSSENVVERKEMMLEMKLILVSLLVQVWHEVEHLLSVFSLLDHHPLLLCLTWTVSDILMGDASDEFVGIS